MDAISHVTECASGSAHRFCRKLNFLMLADCFIRLFFSYRDMFSVIRWTGGGFDSLRMMGPESAVRFKLYWLASVQGSKRRGTINNILSFPPFTS